jgi:hypothetical protein
MFFLIKYLIRLFNRRRARRAGGPGNPQPPAK